MEHTIRYMSMVLQQNVEELVNSGNVKEIDNKKYLVIENNE